MKILCNCTKQNVSVITHKKFNGQLYLGHTFEHARRCYSRSDNKLTNCQQAFTWIRSLEVFSLVMCDDRVVSAKIELHTCTLFFLLNAMRTTKSRRSSRLLEH